MLEVLQIGKQDIPETLPSILEHLTELQEESSTPIPMTDVERGKITRKVSVKDDDGKEDVRQLETDNGTGSASSLSDNTKAKDMWVRERESIGGGGSTQLNNCESDYLFKWWVEIFSTFWLFRPSKSGAIVVCQLGRIFFGSRECQGMEMRVYKWVFVQFMGYPLNSTW